MAEEKQPLTFQEILAMLGFFTNKEISASTIVECIIRDSEINIITSDGTNILTVLKTGPDAGDVIIGDYTGGQGIKFDQSTGLLDIAGGLNVDELHIPDQVTANSFHVDTDGNAWWGSILLADAIAYIKKDGAAKFKNVILSDSVQIQDIIAGSEPAIQQWMSNLTFSATDYRVVAWTSGTITLMDGTTFSISAGNTGNISALTYIYLDTAVSLTVLQTTTTPATAVGGGKVLLAVAQNVDDVTKYAKFQVFSGSGGVGGSFVAADNIIVTTLAAIVANLGTIIAGNITLDTAGYIRGGQTDYATGTGFFLGYSGGAYKFSIGNTVDWLKWDGSILTFSGNSRVTTASDNLRLSADTERSTNSNGSYILEKEIMTAASGIYRIKFDLKKSAGAGFSAKGRIYKNGVAFGTEREDTTGIYQTFSQDLQYAAGDLIQLYALAFGGNGTTDLAYVANFRLYFNYANGGGIVNTD